MREHLPYRKNCEGYLLYKDSLVVRDKKTYLEFPGGGVDSNESAKQALTRESLEEAGAVIKNVRFVGELFFDWGENWAQNEKQKRRYEQFRGEHMQFFVADVDYFMEAKGGDSEQGWEGDRCISFNRVLELLEAHPVTDGLEEYRQFQKKIVKELSSTPSSARRSL